MSKPVDVDQQSHMITHLTGISAPVHTRDTMETGTVLPGFGKLKPIPAPVHTRDTLSWVYPYPCHALLDSGQYGRRSQAHAELLVKEFELGMLWDEYGLVGDIVVSYLFLAPLYLCL